MLDMMRYKNMLTIHMDTKAMYVKWGENVRKKREAQGITQEALAQRCRRSESDRGTDQSTISRIENGTQPPSDELKFVVAAALGATVKELFDFADAPAVMVSEDVA